MKSLGAFHSKPHPLSCPYSPPDPQNSDQNNYFIWRKEKGIHRTTPWTIILRESELGPLPTPDIHQSTGPNHHIPLPKKKQKRSRTTLLSPPFNPHSRGGNPSQKRPLEKSRKRIEIEKKGPRRKATENNRQGDVARVGSKNDNTHHKSLVMNPSPRPPPEEGRKKKVTQRFSIPRTSAWFPHFASLRPRKNIFSSPSPRRGTWKSSYSPPPRFCAKLEKLLNAKRR